MTAPLRAVSPLLLCLVWMGLPRVGLAAQDAPLAPPPSELSGPGVAGEAGHSRLDDESWGRPERYRAPQGLRLLTEVGAGLVTSVAGGFVGGLSGFGLCEATGGGQGSSQGCLGPLVLGALLGISEGYGLGVWWGGEVMGGDGSLPLTLLGSTLGAVTGYALLQAGTREVGLFLFLLVTSGLSHLGYELFQRAPPPGSTASRPRLQPLLTFSASGAVWGLGGRF